MLTFRYYLGYDRGTPFSFKLGGGQVIKGYGSRKSRLEAAMC